MNNSITFDEAYQLAHEMAKSQLQDMFPDLESYISNSFLEAPGCWIFFKNEKVDGSVDTQLQAGWAYAVSKTGDIRQVYDFSRDREKMNRYLQAFSQYSLGNKVEASILMTQFMADYGNNPNSSSST